jgi:hypothetical protein
MGMFFKNKKSQQNIVYTRRVLPIATMKSKKDSSPARCPGDPSCTYKNDTSSILVSSSFELSLLIILPLERDILQYLRLEFVNFESHPLRAHRKRVYLKKVLTWIFCLVENEIFLRLQGDVTC